MPDASDEEKEEDDPLIDLKDKLSDLSTAHNIVQSRHHDLVKAISDFESGKDKSGVKLKEKAAIFKISSDALTKVSHYSKIYKYMYIRQCTCMSTKYCHQ